MGGSWRGKCRVMNAPGVMIVVVGGHGHSYTQRKTERLGNRGCGVCVCVCGLHGFVSVEKNGKKS